MTFTSNSPEETAKFAESFAENLKRGDVIAYRGDLGAGKTAFTQGLARGLNITADVTSPTFSLLNIYHGDMPLYHFDMYRICGFDALYSTGFFDYLDGDGVIAIEWSENIAEELPENTITITITPTSETGRIITIERGRL